MPAARLIFTSGPAQVTFDRSGRVTSLVHRSRPDLGYLTGATIGSLRLDGRVHPPPVPEVLADVDEVEFVHVYDDRLRVVVRHTFAAGWGIRIAFSSLVGPDEPALVVEDAELGLEPQPGCVAWALALGVTAAYSVAPDGGDGSVLGGVLRRGSVDRVTEHGMRLSRLELPGGARYVHQLQWDWYPTPRAFGQERYPEAPSALFVPTGETVSIGVDEDVAVLAPDEIDIQRTPDRLEVTSETPGTFGLELRSARGTTAFRLHWVAPVEELLASSVPAILSRPRTSSGLVRLAGVAEALLTQHALARNQVDDPDVAAEALDLFTARLGDHGSLRPLEVAYLCREYDRLGDADLLDQAIAALLAQPVALPGLGLAATQLCLALIVSGRSVEQVLAYLLRLLDDHRALADDDPAGARGPQPVRVAEDVSARAAQLELIAVTRAGPGIAGTLAPPPDATSRVAALGLHLGAGLKGQPVHPLPVAVLSHLVTVFQLLPDGLSARLGPVWGCSAHELARRAVPELLARLEGQPVDDAHAWLLLALQTS